MKMMVKVFGMNILINMVALLASGLVIPPQTMRKFYLKIGMTIYALTMQP